MNRLHYFLLGLFLFAGCSPPDKPDIPLHLQDIDNLTVYSIEEEPAYRLQLIHEQSFGDTGNLHFRHIGGALADESNRVILFGNVNGSPGIHVFNPDGSHLSAIGRTGSGPGEFRMLLSPPEIKSNLLYHFDPSLLRVNVFSMDDFSLDQTFILEPWDVRHSPEVDGMLTGYVHPRNDQSFLIGFSGQVEDTLRQKYLITGPDGQALSDVILELYFENKFISSETSFGVNLDFKGRSLLSISESDEIYTTWTEEFLIRKYDSQGEYHSAFYYPLRGGAFDREQFYETNPILRARPDLQAIIENEERFPDTWPVLESILVDDEDRIWAATTTDEFNLFRWRVLESDGELLAEFIKPRDQRVLHIKNGYLYMHETVEESGLQSVEKYRIELTAW